MDYVLSLFSKFNPLRHYYKFDANKTDERMLDMNNYGEIYHKHKNCQDIRTDGTCRLIRLLQEKCQETKRNYHEEIKKVLKHNPSSKTRDII